MSVSTILDDLSAAAQQNVLTAMSTTQSVTLKGLRAVASKTERLVPKLPTVPGITPLVEPQAVVQRTYDFAEKLLESQRAFSERALATLGRGTV
jgi:hypothetical protein